MQSEYGSVPVSGDENNINQKNTQHQHELHRHLSLFDLVCVGVGATVGSGVFVLVGLISHTQAGPAVSVSWMIAGVAACASGLCYAELGGRFPSVGSSYVYAKETMGECAAVIAGACLTLEYTGRFVSSVNILLYFFILCTHRIFTSSNQPTLTQMQRLCSGEELGRQSD